MLLPWHRNAHVLDVSQEVVDAIKPGNNNNFCKSKVEDRVGGVVVEQAEHEDARGEAAGQTSEEAQGAAEMKFIHLL